MRRTTFFVGIALSALLLFSMPAPGNAEIHEDLKDALSKANESGKLLLVDFYGSWCPWCVKMDETLEDSGVKEMLEKSFFYYKLDVGHFDKHEECIKQYGVDGIPHIIIFNPSGEIIISDGGYKDAEGFKKLMQSAIEKHQSANASIHKDLEEALSKANSNHKLLLVDFYGDWCPWCVKMDETLADAGVRDALDTDFFYFKLDVGRFDKHEECIKQYGVDGIPYIIVFTPKGKVLVTNGGYLNAEGFREFLAKAVELSKKDTGKEQEFYRLEDFKDCKDPVEAAVIKAAKTGKKVVVYFYEDGTEDHKSVLSVLSANDLLKESFVIFAISRPDNAGLGKYYGCSASPFVIVFNKAGKSVDFSTTAFTDEELVKMLKKAAD